MTGSSDPEKTASRSSPRRKRRPSREKLVARLWAAADAQLGEIETRLAALGGEPAAIERDARSLGQIARFLKDLVGVESLIASTDKTKPPEGEEDEDAPPRDLDVFREELARRLDRLREERESRDRAE